jgi:hypothetical protein
MHITALTARKLLAVAALIPLAAFVTACGGGTVTVTVPPSAHKTSSPSSTPAPSPSSTLASTQAGPAECTTADLKVSVGSSNGAAGTIYYNLDFTNTSASNCFVQGYPGVSLVSAGSDAGKQIGAAATREPGTPSRPITLAPGKTGHAVFGVAEAGNFPPSSCKPVNAHWLKVFPPDQTVAAFAAFTTQTCASASVATMRIQAITSGA